MNFWTRNNWVESSIFHSASMEPAKIRFLCDLEVVPNRRKRVLRWLSVYTLTNQGCSIGCAKFNLPPSLALKLTTFQQERTIELNLQFFIFCLCSWNLSVTLNIKKKLPHTSTSHKFYWDFNQNFRLQKPKNWVSSFWGFGVN